MTIQNGKTRVNAMEEGNEPRAEKVVFESRELMVNWKGQPADKKTTGTWRGAWYINFFNVADTLAIVGIGLNLVSYLTVDLHQSVSKAGKYANNFLGTTYFMSVFWGFIADSYLGKFWTITVSAVIYIVGLTLLTAAASTDSLQPADCVPSLTQACAPAGSKIMTPVVIALYVIAVGSGGVKPTMSAFGADQFDDTEPVERAQGVHYFVWFFTGMQFGALVACSLMVYLMTEISFGVGYGATLATTTFAVLVFWAGSPKYRNKPPSGSPLTRMAQVVVAAIIKSRVKVPEDKTVLYENKSELSAIKGSRKLLHTNALSFLDRAAIILPGDLADDDAAKCKLNFRASDPWRLCTVTQVEEFKRIAGMLPIWATTTVVYISYAQLSSYTIAQGYTMDRHLGDHFEIPPVSLTIFAVVTTVVGIPIYDRYFVSLARRFTGQEGGISPLQRIGTGMVLVVVAYLAAVGVEEKRLGHIRNLGFQNSAVGTFELPMSVFWLAPVYIILAIVEVFTTIGQLEFFYAESTDGTRSLGTSFFYSSISIGYYLSTAVVDAVESRTSDDSRGGWLTGRLNNGGLKYYFYLLAMIMALDFCLFLIFAQIYKYKKREADDQESRPLHAF